MPEAEAATSGAEEKTTTLASTTRRPRVRQSLAWVGFAVIALLAALLSLQAYEEGLPDPFQTIPQFDKLMHFAIGGALAFFLDIIFRRRMLKLGARGLPLAAVVLLVPAAIEEYMQRFSDYRSSSIWDFTADVAGVVFFIWLSRRLVK